LIEAFLQGLREHGWVEGRNLIIERRSFEGFDGPLHDLAMALIQLKVEAVITQ
jgi:hypothetical protein